jgi:DNA-binding CsgD family transcriptional regulator
MGDRLTLRHEHLDGKWGCCASKRSKPSRLRWRGALAGFSCSDAGDHCSWSRSSWSLSGAGLTARTIDDDTGSIDLDDVVALLVCDDVGAQLAVTVIAGARQRHDVVVVALDSAPAVRADVRLPSTAELDDLLKAVRSTATTGATAYAAVPSQAPAGVVGTARLTSREAEVVALLMEGTRSARIADELGISVNTVRSHVQNIMSKPGVNSRLEVAGVVAQNGSGGVAAGLGVR